jgi:heme/copper-type cytochrome/quinol oxidase subunit 3
VTSIPYTIEIRPDTGVTNPKLGMWVFLASEVMLFGSLFSAYALLRWADPNWPDQSSIVSVPLGTLNTAILIASSVSMAIASKAARTNDAGRARRFMLLTSLCGLVFLGIKGFEYAEKLSRGLRPATNNFLGLYFVMTGVHALHVLGGLAVLAFLLGPGARMAAAEPPRYAGRVDVTGIYWQFIDVVWLILFSVLYLL